MHKSQIKGVSSTPSRIASNTSKLKLPWNRDYYVEANLSEEDRDAEAELLFFTVLMMGGWMSRFGIHDYRERIVFNTCFKAELCCYAAIKNKLRGSKNVFVFHFGSKIASVAYLTFLGLL